MKSYGVAFGATLVCLLPCVVSVENGSPVTKVTQLLADLEAKIVREGKEAEKLYVEFTEWCEDNSKNLKFSIKTAKSEIESLKATIVEEAATEEALTAKVEELGSSISTDEADLKAATEIRVKAAADFKVTEKDLTEVISALQRAVAILSREMRKGGALVQLRGSRGVIQALTVLVQAAEISTGDASALTALVQSGESQEDEDVGAPDAAAYKGHSDGIIETLEDLLDKAKTQLESTQKKEMNEQHNFDMLKQSLEDEMKYASKDMDEAKKSLAASNEAKATAEGDLAATTRDLKTDEDSMETVKGDCMTASQEHETETASRAEEIKAIQEARKVLAAKVDGADALTYGEESFFQKSIVTNSRLSNGADLANFEAVQFVRNLARQHNDEALAQLAMRMASVMRFSSSSGEDPFAKVKALITDMITRLEGDAQADASHKAYCDKETGETLAKKQEKEALVEHLTTRIDSMKASSAQLKEQIAGLQKNLAEIATSTAEATALRNKEKAQYEGNKKEMEEGIEGVKLALGILRDYYAKDAGHTQAEGAASGILGLLEVVEADFSKGLSEMNVGEQQAASEYRTMMNRNEIDKATKDQSVKYKTKESVGLDHSVAEVSSDLAGTRTELAAVVEYLGKMNAMCVAKPETYSTRKARREEEIAGLQQALQILSGEAVFLQKIGHGVLRGVKRH